MTALAWGARHGTIMQQTDTADGGFGTDPTWAAISPIRMRLTTTSSDIARLYKRDGFENLVTIQCENRLERRVSGHTTIKDLLLASDQKRMRINYRARTMSIMGVRFPNDGEVQGLTSPLLIDCIEAPQPQGILDVV